MKGKDAEKETEMNRMKWEIVFRTCIFSPYPVCHYISLRELSVAKWHDKFNRIVEEKLHRPR